MAYSLVQPERIPQISAIDPNSIANSAFIAGVYLAAAGRTATEAEQARFAGKTAAEVANIVLGPQYSPFSSGSKYYVGDEKMGRTPSSSSAPATTIEQDNAKVKELYGPDAYINPTNGAIMVRQDGVNYPIGSVPKPWNTNTRQYEAPTAQNPRQEIPSNPLNPPITSQPNQTGWDEQAYLDANPDVAQAVKEGRVASGYTHWLSYGKNENRPLSPNLDTVINQLREPYRTLINEMRKTLDDIKARGQTVNPNITITPEKAAEFMHQAQQEIDPYYASQLKLAKEGFLRTIGYDKESILKFEDELDKQFKKSFKQIGEGAAEKGFALSGQRQTQERELAQTAQGQIDESRRGFANRAQDLGRALYGQYGNFWDEQAYLNANPDVAQAVREGRVSSGYNHWLNYGKNENRSLGNATRLEAPDVFNKTYGEMQIREYPQYLPTGGVNYNTTQKPIYSLSPDIYDQLVGSEEYARRAATRSRASELESAFREQQNINQQRQLTI